MKVSIIISVYKNVRYTEMVLRSSERQSFRDFEIIIADDGSQPSMKEMVENYKNKSFFSIMYLWQPDEGFRKTRILNSAIRASTGDYLIFVDGDCLLHHHFILDHWRNRENSVILCGRRVNFGKNISRELSLEDIESGRYEKINWKTIRNTFKGEIGFLEKGYRIPNKIFQWFVIRQKASALGSNLSLFKSDILKVNGFNEDYCERGYGEDCDLEFRLKLKGFNFRQLKNLAIQYHLYHTFYSAGDKSRRIFEEVILRKEAFCRNGLVEKKKKENVG